jgi:CDP-diacylglycerol--glycerol-3-phosphate 3-phosphatidyltransferase
MAALMLSREFAVSGLREIAAAEQVIIHASPMAKAKTVLQIVAILCLILDYQLWPLTFYTLGVGLLTLSLVLSLISGVEYYVKWRRGLQYRW